jgi:hypothetical protein
VQRSSDACYHGKLTDTMHALGWFPSKADPDIWMKGSGMFYEYISTYVEKLLYAGRNGQALCDELKNNGYTLKGIGPPACQLGNDFKLVTDPEEVLTLGSYTYIKNTHSIGQY